MKINGEEKELVFDTPIEHFIKEYNENIAVQIKNYPLFISTNSIDSTEYSFEYYTDNDVTITDFSFNDFLDIKNAVISVNGETKGSLKNSLPIDIKADSDISVKCNIKIKDSNTI